MTITNGYATLDEIKAIDVLNFATTNTTHDTTLETIIEGISRNIDNYCARFFYSSAAETRYFTAESPWILPVDDVATTASFTLVTDDDGDGTYENTWAATDYELGPFNNPSHGFPYTSVERTTLGNYSFPNTRKGVKITATFGWSAVPKPVNRACVLQATRLFKRYVTPLGQAGATAVGSIVLTIPKLDADVEMLLRPYVRFE